MHAKKFKVITFASFVLFMYSCGNTNSTKEADGHNHTEMVSNQKESLQDIRNEKGELIDETGNVVVGCPMHKEMIGSEGDMCPKCDYMTMVPITWSMEGIEPVSVTSLPDYNPPTK